MAVTGGATWDDLLDRVGGARQAALHDAGARSADERAARFAADFHRVDESAAEVLLGAEIAAAAGETREALRALETDRAARLAQETYEVRKRMPAPSRTPPVGRTAPAVISIIAATVGPVLAFRERRGPIPRGFILDVPDAAFWAGVLTLAVSVWFVAIEFRGGRRWAYSASFNVGLAGFVALGLSITAVRAVIGGWILPLAAADLASGDTTSQESVVLIGLAMQVVAVALYLVAFLLGRRPSAQDDVAARVDTAFEIALDVRRDDIDDELIERMRALAADQHPNERRATRAPVLEALRALHERDEMFDDEAEWALREAVAAYGA